MEVRDFTDPEKLHPLELDAATYVMQRAKEEAIEITSLWFVDGGVSASFGMGDGRVTQTGGPMSLASPKDAVACLDALLLKIKDIVTRYGRRT